MDALIVGGGIIGAAVARELARRGVSVTMIVRGPQPLSESATAAAVGTLSYSPSAPMSEGWHLLARHSLAAHQELRLSLQAEISNPPVWYWPGRLNVATTNAAEKNSRERLKADQAAGDGGYWLDKKAIHDFEPNLSNSVQGGSFKEGQGWVNAADLTRALVQAVQQYGAHLITNECVKGLHLEGSTVRGVITENHSYHAELTIIAAGAWSGQLEARLPLPLEPIRGQAVYIPVGRWPDPPDELPIRHLISGNGIYMIPDREGVTIGATHEKVGFQPGVTVGGATKLLHNAIAIIPMLAEASWNYIEAWSGLRPATPDKVPIIGPDPRTQGLWWATGHFRSGILLAPYTAKVIADALLEGASLDPLWSPARFL